MRRIIAAFLMTIVVGVPFLAGPSPVAAQSADEDTIEAALEFIRGGDVDRGVFILQRLAGQGNADSLFHLGELFRLGVGREQSGGVATMYYRLASALGHKRASLSLANMLFFEGDGSEKTIGEALGVWQSLALEGDVESVYMLGMIYWNGEAGLEVDPVRGYGLVWRAAEAGYSDAVQNELTMRSMLPAAARDVAMEYGKEYEITGFGSVPLALDLLKKTVAEEAAAMEGTGLLAAVDENALSQQDTAQTKSVEKVPEPAELPLEKPEDWSTVWRLEVGFAMSEIEVRRLQSMIGQNQEGAIGKLFSDIQPSITRPGLFRLVYGPLRGMHQAVNTCVMLKRAGHDCSAKAPE